MMKKKCGGEKEKLLLLLINNLFFASFEKFNYNELFVAFTEIT
jgi:hypothetical protein